MASQTPVTDLDIVLSTHAHEETRSLGIIVGRHLGPGTVLALSGDLGSGKTVFVQGLAKGLDVEDDYYITSPSYTLINEYPGRHPLFHVDLYRIDTTFDLEDLGLYEILEGKGVVAVEWADRLMPNALAACVAIHFEIIGDFSRKLRIHAKGSRARELIHLIKRTYRLSDGIMLSSPARRGQKECLWD